MISRFLFRIVKAIYSLPTRIMFYYEKKQYGFIGKECIFIRPLVCTCPKKIFLYENTNVFEGAKFIVSPEGLGGKFIMKRLSGAAQGLTVITGNHSMNPPIDKFMKEVAINRIGDEDKDIVVEEDVWLGANVTLLAGVTVGRGSVVGAGSVVRRDIPPYSVVFGNPARVVSFVFTPDEIIEREKILYNEEERLDIKLLNKNYKRYFLNRVDEIAAFIK